MFTQIFIFPISENKSLNAKKKKYWLFPPFDNTNVLGVFLSLNTSCSFNWKFTQPRAFHRLSCDFCSHFFTSFPCPGFSVSRISNSLHQAQATSSYFSVCFIMSHNVPDCTQGCTAYGRAGGRKSHDPPKALCCL